MSTYDIRLKLRRDTLSNWQANNPVLHDSELAIVYDSSGEIIGSKIGNGGDVFNDLDWWEDITISNKFDSSDTITLVYDSGSNTYQFEMEFDDENSSPNTTYSSAKIEDTFAKIPDELIEGGTVDISDIDNGNIIVDPSKWTLTIDGVRATYQTLVPVSFPGISLSTEGNQRYIGFYGNNNNQIVKVEGPESGVAVPTTAPANTTYINMVLVTDVGAEEPEIDLSGYVKKSDLVGQPDTLVRYLVDGTLGSSRLWDNGSRVGIGDRVFTNLDKMERVLNLMGTDAVMRIGRFTDSPMTMAPAVELISYNSTGSFRRFLWDYFIQGDDSFCVRNRLNGELVTMKIDANGNATFAGKVRGLDATNSNEFVTLAQLQAATPDFSSIQGDPMDNTSLAGLFNGKADLVGGVVPANQLPSFVDDVLEFANLAAFPATGENGKIYIALDTNITYRWGSSVYVPIGSDLALGETEFTAYRGDRGKIAYDHTSLTNNPHGVTKAQVGLGDVVNLDTSNPANITQSANYRFVTDTEKTTWNAGASDALVLHKADAETITGVKTFDVSPILNFATASRIMATSGTKGIETVIEAIAPVITDSATITLLTTPGNWNSTTDVYTGTIPTIPFQLQYYKDASYLYYMYTDSIPIRIPISPTLRSATNAEALTGTSTIKYLTPANWTYLKTQAQSISGLWNFTNGAGAGTTNAGALFAFSAATNAKAQILLTQGTVDYTGTTNGMLWNNGGEIKFLDNGIVNRNFKWYNNELGKSDGNYVVTLNQYGDASANIKVTERWVYDTDVLAAIAAATWSSDRATITPANSKKMYKGQRHDDGTYSYEAIDDNYIKRW